MIIGTGIVPVTYDVGAERTEEMTNLTTQRLMNLQAEHAETRIRL